MKLPNLTIALFVSLIAFSANVHPADLTNTPPKASPLGDVMRKKLLKEVFWDGVPLTEVVKMLREEFRDLNFIVARNVQSETVSLILREVNLEQFFRAIEFATEGRVRVTWNQDDRLVAFERAPPTTPAPGDPASCRVFNLSRFLADKEGKDVDAAVRSVTEALQEGWTMLREANNDQGEWTPRLSFHKGAKLLIVVGRPYELNVADELIRELQGSESGFLLRKSVGAVTNGVIELRDLTPAGTLPAPREHDSEKPPKPKPGSPAKP